MSDPDPYWHIAAGDLLRGSFDLNRVDLFSAATTNHWIFDQWLPDVAFSVLHQVGGLGAVAWVQPLCFVVLLITIWRCCCKRTTLLVSAVVLALATLASAGSVSPRPQMITFIFTVIASDAWITSAGDRRPRWWLAPLTWLWACCHGMWFLSPAIGVLVVVGLLLEQRRVDRALSRLAGVAVACLAAAMVTPLGPAVVLAPLHVSAVTGLIQEWQPPTANSPIFLATLGLIGMVGWATRKSMRPPWVMVLLSALAFVLAIRYVRTDPVAAAILAPVVAEAWRSAGRLPSTGQRDRFQQAVYATGAVAVLVSLVISVAFFAKPAVAAASISRQIGAVPAGTVICNDWLQGGYLILEHPNVRVTIDGRAELYTVDHIEDYLKFVAARPGWENYLHSTHCTYALVSDQTAVSEALVKQTHWSTVAKGGGYVLLKAPGATS